VATPIVGARGRLDRGALDACLQALADSLKAAYHLERWHGGPVSLLQQTTKTVTHDGNAVVVDGNLGGGHIQRCPTD
jgi:hypothetical protein